MEFKIKGTRGKVQAKYRSLYIHDDLAEKVDKLAIENETSFNNTVISIIEYFFQQQEKDKEEQK